MDNTIKSTRGNPITQDSRPFRLEHFLYSVDNAAHHIKMK